MGRHARLRLLLSLEADLCVFDRGRSRRAVLPGERCSSGELVGLPKVLYLGVLYISPACPVAGWGGGGFAELCLSL